MTNIFDYSNTGLIKSEIFRKLIAQKRTAFSHEQEIRLIYVDVPEETKLKEGLESISVSAQILNREPTNINIEDFGELIEKLNYLNINHAKKTHSVSFSHINGFIAGIMVNPFAPDWYVKTIEDYCRINDICFEGKSTLYQLEKTD